MADNILALRTGDHESLQGLIPGQSVKLLVDSTIMDVSGFDTVLRVNGTSVISRSKLGVQEVVQQLAKNRAKMADTGQRP